MSIHQERNRKPIRVAFGFVAAFILMTFAWFVWGVLTPSDYFANGNVAVFPSLVAALIVGFLVGYRLTSARARCVLLVLVLVSAGFWLFVSDGWWATGPPMPGSR